MAEKKLNETDRTLLKKVADLEEIPEGAHSIRRDGEGLSIYSTENIHIRPRPDGQGITVEVLPGTRGETVHIPVIMSASGLTDKVYNHFDIGEGADVSIVAGCGIHNCGTSDSRHDGIHTFRVGPGARMRYTEKHYGEGTGGGRILNPVTEIIVEEGAQAFLEMVQIEGVDHTVRTTRVSLGREAGITIQESLLTDGTQEADSIVEVALEGENSDARIISRSVARGSSRQMFALKMTGRAPCRGHIQCDSILMDDARVASVPEVRAEHPEAGLIHEAAIGRIAGEQLTKLMTLGLTREEAENVVISSFLNEEVRG